MSTLQRIDPARPTLLQRARSAWEAVRSSWSGPLTSSSPELARYFSDAPSRSGVNVTGDSALTYPAFWAAVSLIAADVASLPLILYKRLPNGGKERMYAHQLFRLLHDEPNPEMTSMVFRETLQAHMLTWGNGYAEIERDRLGRPAALWPLTPNRVRPFRASGSPYAPLQYAVSNEAGGEDVLDASDVLHIPGLGYDGYLGYSVVGKARESLGLGLAMQQFGASFFGNGSTFGGVFSTKGMLPPKNKQDLETSLKNFHQGLDRAHRFIILEGEMSYTKLGVPPDDAQFLESRTFHISEIARWFKLSPHKLSDYSRATFSNIEESNIDHVVTCIRPWLVRWEQELNRKLIASSERRIQFCEHLVSALLRGNTQSRYSAYAVGRQWGWLSADDILEMENGNPLPNGQGQIYLVPQNMWPADQIEAMTQAQASKGQPPQAPAPAESDRTLERALEALERRLELADATVVAAKAEVQARQQALEAAQASTASTAEERDSLKVELAAAQAAVSHLTVMAEDVRSERDRARIERDEAMAQARADLEREQQARLAVEARAETTTTERDEARSCARATHAALDVLTSERDRLLMERDAAIATATADVAREREARIAIEQHASSTLAERDAARHQEQLAQAVLDQLTAERDRMLKEREAAQAEAQTERAEATIRIRVLTDDLVQAKASEAEAREAARQEHMHAQQSGQLALDWEHTSTVDSEARQKAEAAAAQALDTAARHEADLVLAQAIADAATAARQAAEEALEAARLAQAKAEGQLAEQRELFAEAQEARETALTIAEHAQADASHATALQADAAQRALAAEQAFARATEAAALAEQALAEHRGRLAEIEREQTDLRAALAHEEGLSSTLRAAHGEEIGRLQAALELAESNRRNAVGLIAAAERQAEIAQTQTQELRVAEDDRKAAVLTAHRDLIIDVMRRMVDREIDRARRAQTTPEKLAKWIEAFYPGHEELCVTALLPAIRVHVSWMGRHEDAETLTRILVGEHIQESKRQLAAVAEGDAEELAMSLYQLCERWSRDRVSTIANALLQKEIGRG